MKPQIILFPGSEKEIFADYEQQHDCYLIRFRGQIIAACCDNEILVRDTVKISVPLFHLIWNICATIQQEYQKKKNDFSTLKM